MFELKMILVIGIILFSVMFLFLINKLHDMLKELRGLQATISVIRLDNYRTMADIRRRNK